MADGLPHPLPPGSATTVQTAEVTLDALAIRYGLDSTSRSLLQAHVNEFACSGQYANRTAVGPLLPITLNDIQMQVGPRVASAFGIEAAVPAPMPVLKVEVTPGVFDIDFELGNMAQRWFEDEWWTFPLGWLTQWFLEIFSNIASLLTTILINFVAPVSSVEFGDIQLLMHGMVSHRAAVMPVGSVNVITPEVSLGVRRLAMNLPDVDVTPLELLPEWNSPSCDLGNAEDFADWALKLFLCPLEVATNLGALRRPRSWC